jgi:hypothetical protein
MKLIKAQSQIKGDEEGAKKVLQRIAKVNGKALPHGQLAASVPVVSIPTINKKGT